MSTDDPHNVRSANPHLDVRTIPNFVDLLRDEVKKSYLCTTGQTNMMACSLCGPLRDEGAGHNGHLCDDPAHNPHKDEMFVVNTLFPIVFCKHFTPNEEGAAPVHIIEAMAEMFNQIATVFRVHAILVPACQMKLTTPVGVKYMLAIYFFANTNVPYLNAMYDTAAFCEDTQDTKGEEGSDWRLLIGRINFIKNNIPLYREEKPKTQSPAISMGKLIPFHLPGRGQA